MPHGCQGCDHPAMAGRPAAALARSKKRFERQHSRAGWTQQQKKILGHTTVPPANKNKNKNKNKKRGMDRAAGDIS